MSTVTITEEPLGLDSLLAIVDGARVELTDGVRTAIAASRAVVDRALANSDAVYGLTTQVGHGKDTRLSEEQICSCRSLERDRPWPLRSVAGGRRGVGSHVERRRPSDRA